MYEINGLAVASFANINKEMKKDFVSCHEFCFNLKIWGKIVAYFSCGVTCTTPFP